MERVIILSPKTWSCLTVEETPRFGVCLGDSHKIIYQGMCEGLTVELDAITVTVDEYLFALRGVDLIIGVSLETLGEVRVDWSEMIMKFQNRGNGEYKGRSNVMSFTDVP